MLFPLTLLRRFSLREWIFMTLLLTLLFTLNFYHRVSRGWAPPLR